MKSLKLFLASILILAVVLVVGASPLGVKAQQMTDVQIKTMIAQLRVQIADLMAQITQLQNQETVTLVWCYTFDKNLRVGDNNKDISALQTILGKEAITIGDYSAAKDGDFTEGTASAIVEFQEKYASEILTPNGLKHGTGYVASSTRKKLNALYGCKIMIEPKYCTLDAKQCPDGSYVSRTGPNCEFTKCPKTQCTIDSDCPQPNCINAATGATPNCVGSNFKCLEGKCTPSVKTCPVGCICTGDTISCPSQSIPIIKVTSPNGGETYKTGDTITVSWKTAEVSLSQKLDVIRLRAYPNGQEYNLVSNTLNDGQEVIILPSSVPVGAYTLEIKSYINNVLLFDASDSYFKIASVISQCTSDADCPAMCASCPVYTNSTNVQGAVTNCGGCIISKCVDSKCVAHSKPAGPLNVSLDASTPISQNLQLGQKDVKFTRIKLTNTTDTDINSMNGIQIGSDSVFPTKIISNVKIYNDGAILIPGTTTLTNNGQYWYLWTDGGVSIPANTTKVLTISADINSTSSGTARLGIAGLNFNSPGCTTSGMPVYGNIMTIISTASTCPTVNCFIDNCPSNHLPDSNGCINCSTPCQSPITVTYPNVAGMSFNAGERQEITIKWNSQGVNNVYIKLRKGKDTYYGPEGMITGSIPNTGSYNWTVPSTLPSGDDYSIRVIDSETLDLDDSDNYFSIVVPTVGINVSDNLLGSISDAIARIAQSIQEILKK